MEYWSKYIFDQANAIDNAAKNVYDMIGLNVLYEQLASAHSSFNSKW